MNASLRLRLALLVLASIALSVALVLYLTWQRVGDAMVAMEEKNFATLLLVEEERLNTASLTYLASKVRNVLLRKGQLRDASARVQALVQALHTPAAGKNASRQPQELLDRMDAASLELADSIDSIRMEILPTRRLLAGETSRLGLTAELRDAKQRPMRQIFGRLPAYGDFAVLDLPRLVATAGKTEPARTAPYRPVLAYFLPLDDGPRPAGQLPQSVLVSMIPLDDLEKMDAQAREALLQRTREKFRDMQLYDGGAIALLDADGTLLASGGTGTLPPGLAAARAEAGRTGMSRVILPSAQGEMLCLLGSIRTFDWQLVMVAPLSEITRPSDTLLMLLLGICLPIVLLAALLALYMLIRTLRPLQLLTRKTRELAEVDFSAPDALDRLEPLVSEGLPLDRRDELGQLARAYARMGGALAVNIRRLMETTATKERMEGELSAAREIQMGILPPPDGAPEVCGFRASAFLDPAKEVGGDLYDFFTTRDGRRALVLGDVSGKGVPAALFMSMTVTLVRYALDSGLDPAAALSRVNAMLEAHNPGNMFVTLFLALYTPETGELCYANGGHCPPCIVDGASGKPPRVLDKLSGPLVGVMPDMTYTLFTDRLDEHETCLIFTDGVTEAMNSQKELFGEARLMDVLARHRNASPRELLACVFAEIVRFRGSEPQSDDITMLAFCRSGQEAARPGACPPSQEIAVS
ncbi:SpoIIE family protein phosphatase [uncultured Desulfovibrio sp.]|uniref:SpoIIE family protein phosphatase n=1 Tax=uncultured Desulfovibrio sp. TaxID=167968 RepID=UPI00261E7F18|nr:SpoIIE family protein phosphatase [uncultured Desulfovibrio sp.]